MKSRFDHAYGNIQSVEDYRALSAYGFSVTPDDFVEHPGHRTCRFLEFSGPKGTKTYLEFIVTGGSKAARQKLLDARGVGYSLNAEGLFKTESVYQKRFARQKPSVTHRNYNWKQNPEGHLPGWNFLNFGRKPIPSCHIWMTEYEPSPARRKRATKPFKHPNGVNLITGSWWMTTKSERKFLEGLGSRTKSGVQFDCGHHCWISEATDNQGLRPKSGALQAMILQATSRVQWRKFFKSGPNSEFFGRPAYWIQRDPLAPDIVILAPQV
jgi:hypothetical protein